jgi:hypothetical protein
MNVMDMYNAGQLFMLLLLWKYHDKMEIIMIDNKYSYEVTILIRHMPLDAQHQNLNK